MTYYTVSDILIARFRQVSGPRHKIRPVMVTLDIGDDDLVVTPITSVPRHGPGDVQFTQWKQAGLSVPSVARLAKTTLISKRSIIRRIGHLTIFDRRRIDEAWHSLYNFIS